jgi:hypothetical protein
MFSSVSAFVRRYVITSHTTMAEQAKKTDVTCVDDENYEFKI